jgi:hypothetical protein
LGSPILVQGRKRLVQRRATNAGSRQCRAGCNASCTHLMTANGHAPTEPHYTRNLLVDTVRAHECKNPPSRATAQAAPAPRHLGRGDCRTRCRPRSLGTCARHGHLPGLPGSPERHGGTADGRIDRSRVRRASVSHRDRQLTQSRDERHGFLVHGRGGLRPGFLVERTHGKRVLVSDWRCIQLGSGQWWSRKWPRLLLRCASPERKPSSHRA